MPLARPKLVSQRALSLRLLQTPELAIGLPQLTSLELISSSLVAVVEVRILQPLPVVVAAVSTYESTLLLLSQEPPTS
jgi:hypothetical protein